MPRPKVKRVLGIDPGYGRLGYGLVQSTGGTLTCVTYGCVTTPSSLPLERRLYTIATAVADLIREHHPDVCAVETLLVQKNIRTAVAVAEARGAVLVEIARSGVRLCEVGPTVVKQALTSYGRADKRQVQAMVRRVLRLAEIPEPDDAADALAIALAADRL